MQQQISPGVQTHPPTSQAVSLLRRNALESPGDSLVSTNGSPTPGSQPSFLPTVLNACAAQSLPHAWDVRLSGAGPNAWVWAQHCGGKLPQQGWKLHISATVLAARQVLKRALPVLLAEDASFKVAGTLQMLARLNSGVEGLSQIGKFVTIYPNSDRQAVRLAKALHRATDGLPGPSVPSDRPLQPGSLVHYRYGAFVHMSIPNHLGGSFPGVRTPRGEMVRDERKPVYGAPEWATDPFISGGISVPPAEPNPLVAGRYLVISTLSMTARGTVHAAIDLLERRRCVLKRAYKHAAMGFDGTDAWDRLRNEASVLERLSPDHRFPQLFEVFEDGGELFLAMEDIDGETLDRHIGSLSKRGCHLTGSQVVAWGVELAEMLRTIHGKGLAYRDLKSSNIIVAPGGTLRLIDFDVAMDLEAPRPLYSPGTYGYLTREQERDEPPRVAHDIYALGAVLYFISTGAEPYLFPHHFDLLRREIRLVNPDISIELSNLIARCLHPDPSRRYESAEDALTALKGLRPEGEGLHDELHISTGERARSRFRELARRVADTLCERALNGWVHAFGGEHEPAPRDISMGRAGAVLALAELCSELQDAGQMEILSEAAHDLARSQSARWKPFPGLYVGEAGVGAALLRAGQVLGDASLAYDAWARGRLVAGLPHSSPSLFNGTAGRARYHLLLWEETAGDEHLNAAIEAGERLLQSAEDAGDGGLRWTIPDGFGAHSGRAYLGYSLGAAGIGDVLLDLYEASGEERFLEGAKGAFRWIAANAVPALDDGTGLDWPKVEGEELSGGFWGHGASGIGRFLLHAAQLDAMPGAMELLIGAVRTAANGTRWAGPTIGYGLCGPIELLLDMYQWTGEGSYLRDAFALGEILESFALEQSGFLVWPSEDPHTITPSLMAGYAGVACTLVRLSAPERVPHLLGIGGRRIDGRLRMADDVEKPLRS